MQVRSLGQEDPLEEGMAILLQYSCLENPIDRGAWWATVHGIAKSQTQLKQLSTHAHIKVCKGKRLLFWRKTIRERLHTRGV